MLGLLNLGIIARSLVECGKVPGHSDRAVGITSTDGVGSYQAVAPARAPLQG